MYRCQQVSAGISRCQQVSAGISRYQRSRSLDQDRDPAHVILYHVAWIKSVIQLTSSWIPILIQRTSS